MSIDTAYLALQLEGPLQSWGFDSQFNRRNTGLMPTKSGILGICLAALGIERGSEEESALLAECAQLRLLTVAIPRSATKSGVLPVRRILDFHTVLNTKSADGANKKDAVLTYRQYLCDAAFACVLSGDNNLIVRLAYGNNHVNPENGLANPVWGIFLGRKSCIPTKPVFVGVYESEIEALNILLDGKPLKSFTRQREVERFDDGHDSLPDQPICFAAPDGIRKFAPRRVRIDEASV